MRHWTALLCALLLFCASARQAAAEEDKSRPRGATLLDTARARAEAAIRWYLPDQFDAARSAAREQNRILLIKGVSFGIDEAGAACATKGKW